jgi:hypothetical protein
MMTIDNALNLDDLVNILYNRMFTKYYSGNELNSWHQLNYFGGGNSAGYKFMIKKLLEDGFRVKTGYRTSSKVRGSKTHYIRRHKSEAILKELDKKRKPGSGGKRENSGRPSPFKEKTKGVKFMCPISKEPDLKKYVNRKLLEWSKSGI